MVLTTWLRRRSFSGREQQVDHQLDHLARGEVLPGLLVRLLRADPDELLEDQPFQGDSIAFPSGDQASG